MATWPHGPDTRLLRVDEHGCEMLFERHAISSSSQVQNEKSKLYDLGKWGHKGLMYKMHMN